MPSISSYHDPYLSVCNCMYVWHCPHTFRLTLATFSSTYSRTNRLYFNIEWIDMNGGSDYLNLIRSGGGNTKFGQSNSEIMVFIFLQKLIFESIWSIFGKYIRGSIFNIRVLIFSFYFNSRFLDQVWEPAKFVRTSETVSDL